MVSTAFGLSIEQQEGVVDSIENWLPMPILELSIAMEECEHSSMKYLGF